MSGIEIHEDAHALPWRSEPGEQGLPVTLVREPEPGDTVQVPTEYPAGWLPRPPAEVAASWLRQVTLVPSDRGLLRLQAHLAEPVFAGVHGDQSVDRPATPWPLASALLVIGAVRGPVAMLDQEAAWSRDELARRLGIFGVRTAPATTVDRDHQWAEPSVIALPGTLDGEPVTDWQLRALDISRQLEIRTVVRVTDGRWEVLSLGEAPARRFTVIASADCTLTRDDESRCPMQLSPAAGEYCRMHGGPWSSSSIHAAAGWRDQRDRLVAAVGCDTCEGTRYMFQGRISTGGGPVAVVRAPAPTRWLAPDDSPVELVESEAEDVLDPRAPSPSPPCAPAPRSHR